MIRVEVETRGGEPAFAVNTVPEFSPGCGGQMGGMWVYYSPNHSQIDLYRQERVVASGDLVMEHGTPYYFQLEYDGRLFSAKVWRTDDEEPLLPTMAAAVDNIAGAGSDYIVIGGDHVDDIRFEEVIEIVRP